MTKCTAEPTALAAGGNTEVSGKALAAGSSRNRLAAIALPFTHSRNALSLLLMAVVFCVSGCQIGGALDGNQRILLAPTPVPKPVTASRTRSHSGLVSSRREASSKDTPAFINPIVNNNTSSTSRGSTSFNTSLTDRLNKSQSSVASAEPTNLTTITNKVAAKKRSSSKLVAFQEDAANPTEAAKIPSDLTLPFEDSTEIEGINDGDLEIEGSESNTQLDTDIDSDSETDTDTETGAEDSTEDIDEDGESYQRNRNNGSPDASAALSYNANSLALPQVINSVKDCYPEIEIAIGDIEQARGKIVSSWGEFDTTFDAYSISKPLSFYEQYRNGTGLTRPLYGGGEVYGGYRSGRGTFEPWYGERETDQAGEFKVGFSRPLLKDRDIDKRRAALIAAGFARDQVEANVETRLLQFERFATQAYWDWVASGQAVVIQQQLLKLAQTRVEQISLRIEQGDLAKIAEIDNDRFIAKRKNSLIKARRGLEKAAIKLSLFYRDANCSPIVADEQQLPLRFPQSAEIAYELVQNDIGIALQNRPELVELAAARREACIKLQYANNLLLPKLDVKGFAAKDIGNVTSSAGDKRPFELEIGVFAEVPIQRREGAGKIQTAQGKITQIDAKRRLVSDKIRAEIQDSASAVNAAYNQIQQSRENVRLNEQSLELGRLAFEEGDIDLLALNIYESSVADARLELLEAEFKYFSSLAIYQTITRSEAFVDR